MLFDSFFKVIGTADVQRLISALKNVYEIFHRELLHQGITEEYAEFLTPDNGRIIPDKGARDFVILIALISLKRSEDDVFIDALQIISRRS